MDDVKNKSSWFFHETPDAQWGVFPRLGYDIFTDRKDGWKVTMKRGFAASVVFPSDDPAAVAAPPPRTFPPPAGTFRTSWTLSAIL